MSQLRVTQVADSPKSQFVVGRANNSASMPSLRAVGTLNTTRDEQVPAVVLLQILDVGIERGHVEGHPRSIKRVFAPTS